MTPVASPGVMVPGMGGKVSSSSDAASRKERINEPWKEERGEGEAEGRPGPEPGDGAPAPPPRVVREAETCSGGRVYAEPGFDVGARRATSLHRSPAADRGGDRFPAPSARSP